MLVADTSALISLQIGGVLDRVLAEWEVVTTTIVVEELESTAAYDDVHGNAAAAVLSHVEALECLDVDGSALVTSRIDSGEASCVVAARDVDAAFLLTDDYRALPEVQTLFDAEVALSPVVLRALVKRSVLTTADAERSLETIASDRDWLGAPIYRYARTLIEEPDEE